MMMVAVKVPGLLIIIITMMKTWRESKRKLVMIEMRRMITMKMTMMMMG